MMIYGHGTEKKHQVFDTVNIGSELMFAKL